VKPALSEAERESRRLRLIRARASHKWSEVAERMKGLRDLSRGNTLNELYL